MKPETRLQKALAIENPNIRLAKLEGICLKSMPHSELWKKAKAEAKKLREAGAKYW